MTDAEERGCCQVLLRYRSEKSLRRQAARETLICGNLKNAVHWMRKRAGDSHTEQELISLAYPALIRAASNFNPAKSNAVSFFRYAKIFLRAALHAEWKKSKRANAMSPLPDDCDFEDDEDGTLRPRTDDALITPPSEREIESRDLWHKIVPHLERLNAHERGILQLVYFKGMSFAEIARMSDVCRQGIAATHSRAILKLRRILIKKGIQ